MIKLTRLNKHPVVVNPDHVYAADATPDTTLRLLGGDCIIVLETLEELVEKVVAYRRHIRDVASDDAISVAAVTERQRHDARKDHER